MSTQCFIKWCKRVPHTASGKEAGQTLPHETNLYILPTDQKLRCLGETECQQGGRKWCSAYNSLCVRFSNVRYSRCLQPHLWHLSPESPPGYPMVGWTVFLLGPAGSVLLYEALGPKPPLDSSTSHPSTSCPNC